MRCKIQIFKDEVEIKIQRKADLKRSNRAVGKVILNITIFADQVCVRVCVCMCAGGIGLDL